MSTDNFNLGRVYFSNIDEWIVRNRLLVVVVSIKPGSRAGFKHRLPRLQPMDPHHKGLPKMEWGFCKLI